MPTNTAKSPSGAKPPVRNVVRPPMPPVPPTTADRDSLMILLRRLIMALFCTGGALLAAIAAIILLVAIRPQPQYFAFTPSLKLIRMDPLDRPVVPPAAVLQWSTTTAMRTLNFGYTNYRQVLTRIQDRYTKQAYTQLIGSLKGTFSVVASKNLDIVASPVSAPVIVKTGVIGGRFAWLVQFRCVESFEPRGVVSTQHLIVNMTVMRVPAYINPRQIVVAQIEIGLDNTPDD